jgi:ferritin-like metal-binding protein YciE
MKSTTAKKVTTSKNGLSKNKTGAIKPKTAAAAGLRELLIDMLKNTYYSEKMLHKALKKMVQNATSINLIKALDDQAALTELQIKRCEQLFETANLKPIAKKCEGIDGLVQECDSIIENTELGSVRDAGIIAGFQKIKHYKIASYGTLVAFAKTLEETLLENLLKKTLEEEKTADKLLTETAYHSINFEAAAEEKAVH